MFVMIVFSLLAVLDTTSETVCLLKIHGLTKEPKNNRVLDCPLVTFHLPRDNQVYDYIRYRSYVPRMPSATVCTWIETTDFDDAYATIASYATSDSLPNAYRLIIDGPSIVGPTFMDIVYRRNVPPLGSTNKFHICHWFSTESRTSGIYVNGNNVSTFNIGNSVVDGGGILILGQDQDSFGGSFQSHQAFQGNITNFMIWPRVLSESEVNNLAKHCQCPIDYSIIFSLDRVELFGEASYSIPEHCPIT